MATNLQDGKRCFIVTQTMQNTHYPTISKDQTFFLWKLTIKIFHQKDAIESI